MKVPHARFLLLSVLFPGLCHAQSSVAIAGQRPAGNHAIGDSPAQQSITAAKRQISSNPKRAQSFNDLAVADLRRARETADPSYYQDADQALKQGLALDGKDFQLLKTQVALMLARHEFPSAKEQATLLNRREPDDVMTYGYMAEADIALGDYPEAEKSVQWMLNMRQNNVPGLLLGAELRNLYGDPEGAVDFLDLAYTETSPEQTEELAWIANRIASVQIESGKSDAAAAILERAEQLFPRYSYTMENLARVRLAQHRANDAVALLLQARQMDGNPHVVYELAHAQSEAGLLTESAASYADFEKVASSQSFPYDDATRDLILRLASNPASAAKALTVAQSQMAARHDVWTLDAYAWALYGNGKFPEANAAIQKAMAVGVQSSQIFNHAGHIAHALKHNQDAAKYFGLSMRADPSSEFASDSGLAVGVPVDAPQKTMTVPAPAVVGLASTEDKADAAAAAVDVALALPPFSAVPSPLLTPHATDTERLIHAAQAKVSVNPRDAKWLAGLGAAYFQRARETGDVNDYQLAEEALSKSLDVDSSDFSADAPLETMAQVCMGEHRFDDALAYSEKALALGSGDVSSFAIVGDAHADKGEYDKAALDYARLGSVATTPGSGYARDSRLAYLKFISGDTAGAVRLMKRAVSEGVAANPPGENLAWLYYELGEFSTLGGDVPTADAAYLTALTVHPGDYRALAGLAKLRGNQGKYAEAIALYKRAIAVVPMPIFVGELGDLYAKTGNDAEAKKQHQLVEYIGLLGHINQVLHNRDLALFYADHNIKLDEALELARKEFEVRHDVYTWDALAWALYKNGKIDEAAAASGKALQFGTKDPLLLFHAGMIADKQGRRDQARNELKEALTINPHFHAIYADAAQQQLSLFETQASATASGDNHAN